MFSVIYVLPLVLLLIFSESIVYFDEFDLVDSKTYYTICPVCNSKASLKGICPKCKKLRNICKYCGEEISELAQFCSNCGEKIVKKNLKKK